MHALPRRHVHRQTQRLHASVHIRTTTQAQRTDSARSVTADACCQVTANSGVYGQLVEDDAVAFVVQCQDCRDHAVRNGPVHAIAFAECQILDALVC